MAAFRPERDPQLISLLNDMAWFFFIAPVGTIVVQNLCLGGQHLPGRPAGPDLPALGGPLQHRRRRPAGAERFLDPVHNGAAGLERRVSFTLRLSVFAVYIVVMFLVLSAWSIARATSGSRWHDQQRRRRTKPATGRARPWRTNKKLDQWICVLERPASSPSSASCSSR